MTTQCTPDTHKRGDGFDRVAEIPAWLPDGYFAGHTVKSQLRDKKTGELIAEFDCSWLDDATTRHLRLRKLDTTAWQVGEAWLDVQFKRTSDGFVYSSSSAVLWIVEDVTHD